MPESKATYIGDGIYLEMDKQEVIIYTSNGLERTNEIFVETELVYKLIENLQKWIANE